MKIHNLFVILVLALSVGLVVSCDSDSNAQDMEEPGPMVTCPYNFTQDIWTNPNWMTQQGGGLFDDCGTETNVIELSGGINNEIGGAVTLDCVNQIGTAVEMDGSLFCEASVVCLANGVNPAPTIDQDIYFEKVVITEQEQAQCQSDVEAIAMTLGISCGN